MDLYVDQKKMTDAGCAMVSAGSTVEPITEYVRDVPASERVQSLDKATRQPLWRGYVFVPGEDGGRPEMIAVKLAMPYQPTMPAFGALIEFENLVAVPYADQGSGRVKISFKATGIVPVHGVRSADKAS